MHRRSRFNGLTISGTRLRGALFAACVELSMAACSGPPSPAPAPPPPQTTVFDPLTQQVDRARDVQNTVDQHTADTRKQIEAAEGSDAPH